MADAAQRHVARHGAGGFRQIGLEQVGEGVDGAVGQHLVRGARQQLRIENGGVRHEVVMAQRAFTLLIWVSVITAFCVTSLPVPAVVGMAISGRVAPLILLSPTFSI